LDAYLKTMKSLRYATLTGLLFLVAFEPAHAAPARFAAPSMGSLRAEVRSVCHHYRWSSRRHCTSDKALRFVGRPKHHYASRYYGGTPHYYYEQRDFYWRSFPGYEHHRWHRWPYHYGWPYRHW
jgi:hypothetical protein